MALAANDHRHGTTNGYLNYKCRCDPCRAAWSEYQAARRRKPCARGCGRLAWHLSGREGVCIYCRAEDRRTAAHGTESMYKRCGCDACRRAAAAARRERRQSPSVSVHGRNGYKNGCRCDVCRVDYVAYSREYKRHRRLRASA